MNANELMIGDWVLNKNINKPMKLYPMMFSQMFRQNPNATTEDYNIYPIPLTAEILEKNGWRKYNNKSWLMFRDGCDELNILLGDNYTEIEYLNMIYNPEDNAEVNYGSSFGFPRIIFVHELQHIIRMFEIEKEIKL